MQPSAPIRHVLVWFLRFVHVHVLRVNDLARRLRGACTRMACIWRARISVWSSPSRSCLSAARLGCLVKHFSEFVRNALEFLGGGLNLVENAAGQRGFRLR